MYRQGRSVQNRPLYPLRQGQARAEPIQPIGPRWSCRPAYAFAQARRVLIQPYLVLARKRPGPGSDQGTVQRMSPSLYGKPGSLAGARQPMSNRMSQDMLQSSRGLGRCTKVFRVGLRPSSTYGVHRVRVWSPARTPHFGARLCQSVPVCSHYSFG